MSTVTRFLIALICCAFSINTAFATPNPSFDCAKAGTNFEIAICSDTDLAELDKNLSNTYSILKKQLEAKEKQELITSQRLWLKQRDTSCSADVSCLRDSYFKRLSELIRQKQLLAQKGEKYKNFVFEPVEWSIGKYESWVGQKATQVEQKIEKILIEDNKYLDGIGIFHLSVDDNRVIAKVLRDITDDRKKFTEFNRIDSEGKLTRSETLIAVFDLKNESFETLWTTEPARNTDERFMPSSPLFKVDLNLDGTMDYFAFTLIGGRGVGSMVLHIFDGKTWKKWLDIEMSKNNFSLNPGGIPDEGQTDTSMFTFDFDHDDKLDILFWKRSYSGHPELENFTLKGEEFFHFEEAENGFVASPITNEQAKLLMEQNHLTEKEAFPRVQR